MTWMRLADRYTAVNVAGRVVLLDGDESYELHGAPVEAAEALRALRLGSTRANVEERLGETAAAELLGLLSDGGMLRDTPLPESDQHFQRQLGIWDDFGSASDVQQRLTEAVVVVVGIGGIGAPLCQHMAASGVGKLVVFDADSVAVHNLNRQHPYTRAHIGMPKPEALAQALGALSPTTVIQQRHEFVDDVDELQRTLEDVAADLLVIAADRPFDIQETCWRAAANARVPVTGAAVGRYSGHWGPILQPGRTACPACAIRILDLDSESRREAASSVGPMTASFGPSNALLCDWLAHDAIHFLAGAPEVASLGRRLELSTRDGETRERDVFPACGHWGVPSA